MAFNGNLASLTELVELLVRKVWCIQMIQVSVLATTKLERLEKLHRIDQHILFTALLTFPRLDPRRGPSLFLSGSARVETYEASFEVTTIERRFNS